MIELHIFPSFYCRIRQFHKGFAPMVFRQRRNWLPQKRGKISFPQSFYISVPSKTYYVLIGHSYGFPLAFIRDENILTNVIKVIIIPLTI